MAVEHRQDGVPDAPSRQKTHAASCTSTITAPTDKGASYAATILIRNTK